MRQLNFLFILLAFSIKSLLAQNFNDALLLSEPGLNSGVRALSMGNSFTSLSNDFLGVLFNPAGIGLIKNTELSLGMGFNSFGNTTTFFNNESDASKGSVNFNQFGLIFPLPTIQGSWVFGIGYNLVKDFNRTMEFDGFNPNNNSMIQNLTGDYNEQIPITNDLGLSYEIRNPSTDEYIRDTTLIDGLLNQSGKIKREGNINKWSFASSIEVAKGFFAGATLNILSGNYKSDRDYWEDDTRDIYDNSVELVPGDATTRDFQTFYLNDVIDWKLSGWDAIIGVLYNWKDQYRFGASVKFPSYFNVQEDFLVDASSSFGTGSEYSLSSPISDPIEYEIKTPFEYTIGASANVNLLTISGDIKITDYTQMEFTEGFDFEYRNARKKEIEDLFTTTINFYAGAEMKIPVFPIFARAGFMYLNSPYVDDPTEFDKKYITLGTGILVEDQFSIELAYALGWWSDYGDNYGADVSRTFQDIQVNNLFLNLTTRF
jgi:hypothetical protein